MTMTLVSTVSVGSGGASSIQFTNIPQTGQDLLVLFSIRSSTSTNTTVWTINNSVNGYSYRRYRGDAASASASSLSGSEQFPMIVNATNNATGAFSNGSFYLPNYRLSQNKLVSIDCVQDDTGSNGNQTILGGIWANTSAVTSLKLEVGTGMVQYSTASLYIISSSGATGATVS